MSARPLRLPESSDRTAPRSLDDVVERVLENVVDKLRLTGSLTVRAELAAPWTFESPETCDPDPMFGLGRFGRRAIVVHLVPEGTCWVDLGGGTRIELRGGDVVVIPHRDRHTVGSLDATQIVSGTLTSEDLLFNPFLRELPRAFRVRPPGGAAAWMTATPRSIFVDTMRLHAESLSPEQSGWLAGLTDPILGPAIAALHAAPAAPWTVVELAKRVATSRTVLDERFRKRLGRAPMRYLTEWRLQIAADLLRTTSLAMAEIADRVGYESEASFNRAFRRIMGAPPARWRDRQRAERDRQRAERDRQRAERSRMTADPTQTITRAS
jgi:AraC-like DNA-binding protein